jgi:hypothetical protein
LLTSQTLREAAGAGDGLEVLRPLERAARGAGELARKREILVGEGAAVAEEHDDDLVLAVPDDRRGEERRMVGHPEKPLHVVVKALVSGEILGRDRSAVDGGGRERARVDPQAGGERLRERRR